MERISLCDIPCLYTLSASAFIDSSLHQLDFLLEIFLWRLTTYHLVYYTILYTGTSYILKCLEMLKMHAFPRIFCGHYSASQYMHIATGIHAYMSSAHYEM